MSTNDVPSIDLHGLRKDQAIGSVTRFLEQHKSDTGDASWVCVITGSGSHSVDGPVLREAVRSLLDRREMEYIVKQGKGAFMVNATSGHEFSATIQTTDSKIVVVAEAMQDEDDVNLVNRPSRASLPVARAVVTDDDAAPLPSEVAADDALVQRIKNTSAQEHSQQVQQERRVINQAVSASMQEMERERIQEEERLEAILKQSQEDATTEEERLEQVLKLSQQEAEREAREEEERLQQILKLSQEEQKKEIQEEEELMERALSASKVEVSADEELQAALQKSLHDSSPDRELERALSLSLKEQAPASEDEILSEVLKMSLKEG